MKRLFPSKLRPCLLVGIMLSAALLLAPCAGAFDVEQDLQRLLTEAPSSELFEGSNGLILLREIKYSLTADGSMERTTFWFLRK